MEPVRLLQIGCGMMGARHVRGLGELERVAPGSVRLVALCDQRLEQAQSVAEEAGQLLGYRPVVYATVDEALATESELDAADVVTDPRSHDAIVIPILQAGLDVLCEKPLAVTVARGRRMVDAARREGKVLAVAENNRHDPMNRLARAALDGHIIGDPNFVLNLAVSRGSGIIATAWRHRLAMGGVLLDVAIHMAYIMEYMLGPLERVSAIAQLVQTQRRGAEYDGRQVEVAVDAEDAFSAVLEFASGVEGHWTVHFASPGESLQKRTIIGCAGSMDLSPDRSGRPVTVQCGDDRLSGDVLAGALPEYALPEIETALFGERPGSYTLAGPVTDRKLLAAEMHSFARALRDGGAPEADGAQGLRAVAIVYSVLESALIGRPVLVDEVLSGALHTYQDMVEVAE